MLNSFGISLVAGIVLGLLSGLGVGGGSLLMLWLTLVIGMPYQTARTLNLLFFLPSALVATVYRWKRDSLSIKKIFPAVLCGCISAAVFSILGRSWDIAFLKKLFGILLLVTGLRELFYHAKPVSK